MSDTPHLDALLRELCGLDELDAQLPQAVLINLHRARLHAPLRGLACRARELPGSTREKMRELQRQLAETYGLDAQALEDGEQVMPYYHAATADDDWERRGMGGVLTVEEQDLVSAVDADWFSFDAIVWLFFLSRRELSHAYVPELIEAELVVQPNTHRMILDMAVLAAEDAAGKTS
jgi:hypothetical protein